jgi:hypothetical protein
MIDPLAPAFPTPALRKEREGPGTHCVPDASEFKSWATRLLRIETLATLGAFELIKVDAADFIGRDRKQSATGTSCHPDHCGRSTTATWGQCTLLGKKKATLEKPARFARSARTPDR